MEHRRLAELLECEIRKLASDHRRTAILETLRDHYMRELQVEERRLEQLSLDESFRLSTDSRLGISNTIDPQD